MSSELNMIDILYDKMNIDEQYNDEYIKYFNYLNQYLTMQINKTINKSNITNVNIDNETMILFSTLITQTEFYYNGTYDETDILYFFFKDLAPNIDDEKSDINNESFVIIEKNLKLYITALLRQLIIDGINMYQYQIVSLVNLKNNSQINDKIEVILNEIKQFKNYLNTTTDFNLHINTEIISTLTKMRQHLLTSENELINDLKEKNKLTLQKIQIYTDLRLKKQPKKQILEEIIEAVNKQEVAKVVVYNSMLLEAEQVEEVMQEEYLKYLKNKDLDLKNKGLVSKYSLLAQTIDVAKAEMALLKAIQELQVWSENINNLESLEVIKINFKQIVTKEMNNFYFFKMLFQLNSDEALKLGNFLSVSEINQLELILTNMYKYINENSISFEDLLKVIKDLFVMILNLEKNEGSKNQLVKLFESIVSQILFVPFNMAMKEIILQISYSEQIKLLFQHFISIRVPNPQMSQEQQVNIIESSVKRFIQNISKTYSFTFLKYIIYNFYTGLANFEIKLSKYNEIEVFNRESAQTTMNNLISFLNIPTLQDNVIKINKLLTLNNVINEILTASTCIFDKNMTIQNRLKDLLTLKSNNQDLSPEDLAEGEALERTDNLMRSYSQNSEFMTFLKQLIMDRLLVLNAQKLSPEDITEQEALKKLINTAPNIFTYGPTDTVQYNDLTLLQKILPNDVLNLEAEVLKTLSPEQANLLSNCILQLMMTINPTFGKTPEYLVDGEVLNNEEKKTYLNDVSDEMDKMYYQESLPIQFDPNPAMLAAAAAGGAKSFRSISFYSNSNKKLCKKVKKNKKTKKKVNKCKKTKKYYKTRKHYKTRKNKKLKNITKLKNKKSRKFKNYK